MLKIEVLVVQQMLRVEALVTKHKIESRNSELKTLV